MSTEPFASKLTVSTVEHVIARFSGKLPGSIERPYIFSSNVQVTVNGRHGHGRCRQSVGVRDGVVSIGIPIDSMNQTLLVEARTLPELIQYMHHMVTNMIDIANAMELRDGFGNNRFTRTPEAQHEED